MPEAQYALGRHLADGDAIEQDLAAARQWLERAAGAGHPDAIATRRHGGGLSASPSAETRSHMLIDVMQALMLRARAGASPSDLLRDARSYVPVVVS